MAFDLMGVGEVEKSEATKEEDLKRADLSVWIVVVTKQGQERLARLRLEQQGFEVYLPMKLAQNRRRELVASPFFPKYLFARVTLAVDRWKSIYSTIGVAGVLGRGETPTGVKDEVVERIRAQEDAGFIRMGLDEGGPDVLFGPASGCGWTAGPGGGVRGAG
jgi:transcription antitermination factor NusG